MSGKSQSTLFFRGQMCHGGDPVAATVTQQLAYGYGATLELSKLRTIERRPGLLRPSASSVEGAVPRRLPRRNWSPSRRHDDTTDQGPKMLCEQNGWALRKSGG